MKRILLLAVVLLAGCSKTSEYTGKLIKIENLDNGHKLLHFEDGGILECDTNGHPLRIGGVQTVRVGVSDGGRFDPYMIDSVTFDEPGMVLVDEQTLAEMQEGQRPHPLVVGLVGIVVGALGTVAACMFKRKTHV